MLFKSLFGFEKLKAKLINFSKVSALYSTQPTYQIKAAKKIPKKTLVKPEKPIELLIDDKTYASKTNFAL